MVKLHAFNGLWVLPLLLLACGSGSGSGSRPTTADDGHGHGASYACGTKEEPVTLIIKDIAPAADSSVANKSIVQQFTLVDPPFLMSTLNLAFTPKHTAGTPSPNQLLYTVKQQEKAHVYSATIESWSTSPGHVELADPGYLVTDNDCYFELPAPLFSYDITNP